MKTEQPKGLRGGRSDGTVALRKEKAAEGFRVTGAVDETQVIVEGTLPGRSQAGRGTGMRSGQAMAREAKDNAPAPEQIQLIIQTGGETWMIDAVPVEE